MIEQTPLGRLLCWLGLHLPVVGGWRGWDASTTTSVFGLCVRCHKGWQYDL
jgi:hypothetical protein